MDGQTHVVALSGGKDSSAMALRLAETAPRDYLYLTTPTGDELPEMAAHMTNLEKLLGKSLTRVTETTLDELVDHFDAVPNHRMRWCTRMLKIEPCLAFLKQFSDPILYVGLRADEPERQGIYSEQVTTRFPLREWEWGRSKVETYLLCRGVFVPRRTDCARCYAQRLGEWKRLWVDYPAIYADAEAQEERTGHTFRSPERDSWPASLRGLRGEFERGRMIRSGDDPAQGMLFGEADVEGRGACRVCSL